MEHISTIGNCIIHGLDAVEYHQSKAVSKSALDTFAECPAKYKAMQDGLITRKSTHAMQFGTLLHALVLDGKAEYHVKPEGMTFTTKDGKAWKADHLDKPIVSQGEATELIRTSSAILKHRHAAALFGIGKAEASMFATDPETGLDLKGRADWLSKTHIADIKTTADASNKGLSHSIHNFRYHVQAAMYLKLANLNNLDIHSFYFIAIERGDIPLINVRQISAAAIELGEITLGKQLRDLAKCRETGIWLDYSGDTELPGEIDLPTWSYSDTAGMELIGATVVETNETETIDIN